MTNVPSTRRDFLADAARAAGGFAVLLPCLAALASCARGDEKFVLLTTAEARTMRAFAAQIIPSGDDVPGAEEAGAVHFVDRALGLPFFAKSLPVVRDGLADLNVRARRLSTGATFALLSPAQQVSILKDVERTPFFTAARTLVVIGTFAEPSYGGNANHAGWKLIGMDHQPNYTAPFGWYDAMSGIQSGNSKT